MTVVKRKSRSPRHCPGCRCFDDLSDVEEEAPGKYHGPKSNAPDTEKIAAYQMMPVIGSKRRAVLDAFVERGRRGFTDYELREYMGEHTAGQSGARRSELKDGGWVEWSGRRRTTGHGGRAAVWVLTPAAVERLK